MVFPSASSIARKVFDPPRSWLLRAWRRRNSFNASSPQSKASRSYCLPIGTSRQARPLMAGTVPRRPWRRKQAGRSAAADSQADPEPSGYLFLIVALARGPGSHPWRRARRSQQRSRSNPCPREPLPASAAPFLSFGCAETSGCSLRRLPWAWIPSILVHIESVRLIPAVVNELEGRCSLSSLQCRGWGDQMPGLKGETWGTKPPEADLRLAKSDIYKRLWCADSKGAGQFQRLLVYPDGSY